MSWEAALAALAKAAQQPLPLSAATPREAPSASAAEPSAGPAAASTLAALLQPLLRTAQERHRSMLPGGPAPASPSPTAAVPPPAAALPSAPPPPPPPPARRVAFTEALALDAASGFQEAPEHTRWAAPRRPPPPHAPPPHPSCPPS
jgi:hypothetical protein